MRQYREELIDSVLWWYCSFEWIDDGIGDSHFVIVWYEQRIRRYLTITDCFLCLYCKLASHPLSFLYWFITKATKSNRNINNNAIFFVFVSSFFYFSFICIKSTNPLILSAMSIFHIIYTYEYDVWKFQIPMMPTQHIEIIIYEKINST